MNLTVGTLAKRAGVGAQTVRFYEREGLLAAALRTSSGYRVYGDDAVGRLRFIRRAQDLGFTLKEIRELLALQKTEGANCDDVRNAAAAKLDMIEAKIADLARMKTTLAGLVQSCTGCGPISACNLVECLSNR
jgi:Hg(II)-responsive transcriptional regulator